MINYKRTKKRLIVSYKNLSDDLKALFKENYPDGYKEYLQKITKPNGEPLFVVPMETDDTSYLIRFDFKVDTLQAEDIEKEMFESDDKGDTDDFAPITEAMDKDEDLPDGHTERVLNHGSYEGVMDELTHSGKKQSSTEMDALRDELKEEFSDDDDEEDEFRDDYDDEGDEDDILEPTADDLAAVEKELLADDDLKPAKKTRKTASATPKNAAKTTATKKTAAKKTATGKKKS